MKVGKVSNSFIISSLRLDGNFHLSEGLVVRAHIKKSPYGIDSIGDVTSDVYCPGIFKRNYTKNGIPFLGGSDIQKNYYDCGKYLKVSTTPNHEILRIPNGCTLVTCGGTIGLTVYANKIISKCFASQHVMRVIPSKVRGGVLYAYLTSKHGHALLTTNTYGSVIPTLNADNIKSLPIPKFPDDFQLVVDKLIQESSLLREESSLILSNARALLKQEAGLRDLTDEDYNYFGPRTYDRKVSCFVRNIKELGNLSFHAFNYSERVQKNIIDKVRKCNHIRLYDALDDKKLWSSSGVEVNEVKEGHGIMLINQSDIFDQIVKGKWVVKKKKYSKDLLQEGEILIAKIGTLGEGESFCRTVYVGEDLKGQLVSSAFYRMKSSESIPAGYLFAWLSSDYGFRLIRASHYGTKQCYPNPSFLYEYPVPIIEKEKMLEIDKMVKEAHSKLHLSNKKELLAIHMIEEEIEKCNK